LQQPNIDYVLVLSGDQLYRMNYASMLKTHQAADADVTIGAMPVTREQAQAFGIMRVGDDGRVQGFLEKPKTDPEMDMVKTAPEWIDAHGIPSRGRDLLASMGIYLFNRETLLDVLTKTDYHDFGREIFPASIRTRKVQMHLFDGYWEDIGTIRSFFDCNLALAALNPPFDLASAEAPIYSRARYLPPSKIDGATIKNSLISDGCEIEEGTTIENCVIGLRCKIGRNVTIRNSVIMGADEYETPAQIAQRRATGQPTLGICDGSSIEQAIVDKNVRIGRNVRIANPQNLENTDEDGGVMIRDGIVCIDKGAMLQDGWKMPS
jgi:glucose-1-phosphate adenylyltransferase